MELWDVLDDERNKTGRIVERGQELTIGEYHLIVFAWIKNTEGEFLISKRCGKKDGEFMWETVAGAVVKDESSFSAVIREVKEEIGICFQNKEGKLIKSIKHNPTSHLFSDHWFFTKDINIEDVYCQKEEVSEVKWVSRDELLKLIEGNEFFNGLIYLKYLFNEGHL